MGVLVERNRLYCSFLVPFRDYGGGKKLSNIRGAKNNILQKIEKFKKAFFGRNQAIPTPDSDASSFFDAGALKINPNQWLGARFRHFSSDP